MQGAELVGVCPGGGGGVGGVCGGEGVPEARGVKPGGGGKLRAQAVVIPISERAIELNGGEVPPPQLLLLRRGGGARVLEQGQGEVCGWEERGGAGDVCLAGGEELLDFAGALGGEGGVAAGGVEEGEVGLGLELELGGGGEWEWAEQEEEKGELQGGC